MKKRREMQECQPGYIESDLQIERAQRYKCSFEYIRDDCGLKWTDKKNINEEQHFYKIH